MTHPTRVTSIVRRLGIALALLAPPALSQAAEPPPDPEQRDFSSLHRLAQAVAQLGAPECAPKVHEAAIYLIHDTESGAIAHSRSYDLFSFSLEVTDQEGMTSYMSINVAPGKSQACAISYEIVTPIGMKCDALAKEAWPNAQVGNPLRRQMVPLSLDDGQTVLLHPVGESCLVIRKEIIP